MIKRHRKGQIPLGLEAGDLALEAPRHRLAVEAEMLGIGPDEAERVCGARQPVVAIVLDRLEKDRTNAQRRRDLDDGDAVNLAPGPQQIADRRRLAHRRRRPVRDLGVVALAMPSSREQGHGCFRNPKLGSDIVYAPAARHSCSALYPIFDRASASRPRHQIATP
jgi:hypothetical protein